MGEKAEERYREKEMVNEGKKNQRREESRKEKRGSGGRRLTGRAQTNGQGQTEYSPYIGASWRK